MTSTWADEDLSCDAFLGGAVDLWQPKLGYRAGVDPVLLAASVTAEAGQRILDLGCGVGAAGLCLARRVQGASIVGLELQTPYADLARRNAAQNDTDMQIFDGDLSDPPKDLRAMSFHHVMANPPYYQRDAGTAAADPGRETALREQTILADWVDAAVRRLRPRGYLNVVQRADRLPDLLRACDARLGDLRILPFAPRAGRDAELIILRARKGAKGPTRLLAPVILHRGATHERDGESYTDTLSDVLRKGMALPVDW